MTEGDSRHPDTQRRNSREENSHFVRRPAGSGPPDTTKNGGVPEQTRHGLVKDARDQDQPADKSRAQQQDSGQQAQRDAADQPPSPGQPAGGE